MPYWYHGCVRGAVDLGDLLAIAEQVLGVDAHVLKKVIRLGQAESALAAPDAGFGGEEFYPDPAQKAAILCSRIIRNHPLPDGNKRVAFLSLRIAQHGRTETTGQGGYAGWCEAIRDATVTQTGRAE
jgi:death-on-curing protein